MTLKTFAERYRLRLTKDECDDLVVWGRPDRTNIFEYALDGSRFGVMFTTDGNMFTTDGKKPPRTELFNKFRSACLAAGMTPLQTGDAEGTFTFDPADDAQAKAAIKVARAKTRRRVTPEQAAAGAARLAAARLAQNPVEIHT
jgi:hypothetical protein